MGREREILFEILIEEEEMFQTDDLKELSGIACIKTGKDTYQEIHFSGTMQKWIPYGGEKTIKPSTSVFRFKDRN